MVVWAFGVFQGMSQKLSYTFRIIPYGNGRELRSSGDYKRCEDESLKTTFVTRPLRQTSERLERQGSVFLTRMVI